MKKFVCAIIAAALAISVAGCTAGYIRRSEYVFSDSELQLEFRGYGGSVNKAFDEMLKATEEIDSQTNINREGESDVLAINKAAAGQKVSIGFYTFDMIVLAKEIYQKTNGSFNIAAYPLSYLWGIDALGYNDSINGLPYKDWRVPQSFAGSDINRSLPLPDYAEVQRVKEFCDLDKLTVFEENGEYFAEKQSGRLMIDLGGISKGYAVDLCAEIAQKHGVKSAIIDLAGNLGFVGQFRDDEGKIKDWPISINYHAGGEFCVYLAKAGSTATTSGDYQRFRKAGELDICHIINAQTGLPYNVGYDGKNYYEKQDRIVSCSVLSGKSAVADAFGTAACVMGLDKAIEFLTQNDVQAILYTADKKYAITGEVTLTLQDKYEIYKGYTQVYPDGTHTEGQDNG